MDPDSYLLMSGIQHFCFCRRQWALIHLEQQWAENLRTAEGHLLHERCHDEVLHEKRAGLLTVRGLWKRVVLCWFNAPFMVYYLRRQNSSTRAQRTENPPLPRTCLFCLNVQAALHRQCSLHKYRLLFCGLYPIVQILPENSFYFPTHLLSPSSRRAWVEMLFHD